MVQQINKKLDENFTEFAGSTPTTPGFFGPIRRFFASFFASPAAKELEQEMDTGVATTEGGDTITNTEVNKDPFEGHAAGSRSSTAILAQGEYNRRKRYRDYEEMDGYPEIAAAFDIYADDASQRGPKNEKWKIKSESEMVVKEVESLFETIRLERFLWDIIRNSCKFGDCFLELVLDVTKPEQGLKKLKVLDPTYIIRIENKYGYLKKFLQEIPKDDNDYGYNSFDQNPSKYIDLDKNQIIHFRLHTSDPNFYPYGKSIVAACHSTFRSLRMMEDAMMIYRLSRAPERRIFYIDTGALPTSKAEAYVERVKQNFKKQAYYNSSKGTVDARYNPPSVDEDFYVPMRQGSTSKIDTLPGAQNLGDIDDVRYFQNKLLAMLKIPKDYIVEKDKSPERKANLSQLDVKFARAIKRVQMNVEVGLENIAKRHLQLKGYPSRLIKELRIELPEPSDMSAKRKLDLDEQKTRVIQAVKGLQLFSNKEIYRQYYDMSEDEIERIMTELEQEQEEMAQKQAEQGMMPGMGGPPQPGQAPPGGNAGYGEAGGQEPQENNPNSQKEGRSFVLSKLSRYITEEKDREILDRAIEKTQESLVEIKNRD
jgi:hypothetical protein